MTDDDPGPAPRSPLDPFLDPFLRAIGALPEGYAPASHGKRVAAALDVPPAFAEALFASARARGLLEPYRVRQARGRPRWRVSARGRRWLEAFDRPATGVAGGEAPRGAGERVDA